MAPLLGLHRRAAADEIDGAIVKLRRARAYKARLSAALLLAQNGEPRAIMALARAVEHDPQRLVRRLAALSLARALDAATDGEVRRAGFQSLKRASRRDRDRGVRRSAQLALDRLRGGRAARAPDRGYAYRPSSLDPSPDGRIFVHLGVPGDTSRALPPGGGDALLAAVRGTLRMHAPEYELTAGAPPTRAELATRRLRGYTIVTSVARVELAPNGAFTDVKCTVSVRVGPWSGRDGNERMAAEESASASGNGRVTSSPTGTRRAAVECAVAVAEELAARQVVPFLRRLSSPRSR
ncbi:MAG TPA: hypothetical protein VNO33_20625 [Kofleriaceae bacterium]|nr:hypothetical protein [Kofleriaceae bacterium]